MSPPGEDDTMHAGDAQAQTPKTTFTFALKPMSTPTFVHSMSCNEGINFFVDLNQTGPSFAELLESNIRKSVEMYDFESFHGEIQFVDTKQKNLLESSKMDIPITMKENKTCPHSSRDDVLEKHDLGSPDAPEIPLMQICGSDSQKKRTSDSSCNGSADAMATENVAGTSLSEVNDNQFSIRAFAEEMCGDINNHKFLTEMENRSDKAPKGRKQGKGYLKRYKKIDDVIQNPSDKKVRFKGCSSKDAHDPKGKAVQTLENSRDL